MSTLDLSTAEPATERDQGQPTAQDPLGSDALSDPLDDAVQLSGTDWLKDLGSGDEMGDAHSAASAIAKLGTESPMLTPTEIELPPDKQ